MQAENPVQCAESLRVQARFDGELDALGAAELERHLERCAECRALVQDLERARTLMRAAPLEQAPPELRARVARLLDEEVAAERGRARALERGKRAWRWPSFWSGAAAGVAAAACAAAVALWFVTAAVPESLLDDLVAAHVRSLMPEHLTDVVSTDRHTVKPWFAGHADVSPVVADFADQGYRLVGGRADYFEGHRAAAVVYEHGPHIINVFSWPGARRGLPGRTTRNGYHLVFWNIGNVEYCAVSDTGWDELDGLVTRLRDLGARDARE